MPDPNLPLLQDAVSKLAPFLDEVVFVGGITLGLLITDEAAAPKIFRERGCIISKNLRAVRSTRDGDIGETCVDELRVNLGTKRCTIEHKA